MVAFCNPRKSRIDIIQAVGRAMRKPREGTKTLGYVVVPILLAESQADDLEAASRDTDWEDIVDVLAALREHDTRLEDLIRDAQVAKGRGEVFNPRVFAERLRVLGPMVSLEVLERQIAAVVLERLGVSWDERYGQLVAWKDAGGDVNVRLGHPEKPELATWLSNQRAKNQRGALPAARVERLTRLGVSWHIFDSAWEAQYQALALFREKHGHCLIPRHHPEATKLGSWVHAQRIRYRRDALSADRIAQLDVLGFVWSVVDAKWEELYQALVAHKGQHGHCNVPRNRPETSALGTWLKYQRYAQKNDTLSEDRKARLTELGVAWEFHVEWEGQCQALIEFKARHGHCNVPSRYSENSALAVWLSNTRQHKRRGTLSPDRMARLEALGIVWEPSKRL
jgi:hypothetical protein